MTHFERKRYSSLPPHELRVLRNIRKGDEAVVVCGGKSDVYAAEMYGEDGVELVALKTSRFVHDKGMWIEAQGVTIKEAQLLSKLDHPNIVPILGLFYDPVTPAVYSVMPFYAHGTVRAYLRHKPGCNRIVLVTQLVEAVNYLHRMLVVHGDISPSNVLIDNDGNVRLGDFGCAFTAEDNETDAYRRIGFNRYTPREFLNGGAGLSQSTDIWSLAMTVLEILSGSRPFHRIVNDSTVIVRIDRGQLPRRESDIPHTVWAVLERCWDPIPAMRPSAHALSLFFNVFSLLGEWNFFSEEALGVVGVDTRGWGESGLEVRYPVAMASVA